MAMLDSGSAYLQEEWGAHIHTM